MVIVMEIERTQRREEDNSRLGGEGSVDWDRRGRGRVIVLI